MSQLYITDRKEQSKELVLTDQWMIHHITRVLRMKLWDIVFLQNLAGTRRLKVSIQNITKEQIVAIREEEFLNPSGTSIGKRGIILAMPNKFEKLELIVQKLAEIGIDSLICRPSRRSVLKDISPKKMERLHTIAREATEQSWWRCMLDISFSPVFPHFAGAENLLFDYHEHLEGVVATYHSYEYKRALPWTDVRGIVWPEWGFDPEEIRNMTSSLAAQVTLGDTVLRMETAAIVAGWWMRYI